MKKSKWSGIRVRALSLLLLIGALGNDSSAAPGDVDLSFDPGSGVNGPVNAVVLQPDGKVIIGGSFTTAKGVACQNIARLNPDGSGDSSFAQNGGIGAAVGAIVRQPDGKLLVGHAVGLTRLNTNGNVDTNFIAPAILSAGLNPAGVDAIALQPDGKILIGGWFLIVSNEFRPALARLNANGTLDTTFDTTDGPKPIDPPPVVTGMVVQPDGKVIAAGSFQGYSDALRPNIVRVYADGHLDYGFVPQVRRGSVATGVALQSDGKVLFSQLPGDFGSVGIVRLNTDGSLDSTFDTGTGPNGGAGISAVALQPDEKVLVGGGFTAFNGIARDRITRLNADGSVDSSFDPGPPPHTVPFAIAVQTDGKIVLGGGANDTIAYGSYFNVTRLNTNGSRDRTFVAGGGVEGNVSSVAAQSDGKTLIAGQFRYVNGVNRDGIARVLADGTLDSTFIPDPQIHYPVLQVALQPDGKILACGYSNTVMGGVARLNADGSLDTNFNIGTGVEFSVNQLALQTNGKVLIAGSFDSVNGTNRVGVARLNSNGSLDNTFDANLSVNTRLGAVAVQPDGKVLLGGSLWIAGDTNIYGFVRLKVDGSLDGTFQQGIWGSDQNFGVNRIALQPDGKVLLSGQGKIQGMQRYGIARLRADGSLDPTFDAGEGLRDQEAGPIALQPDGKILIGGWYNLGTNDFLQGVFRLNTNGTLDTSFAAPHPYDYSVPLTLALQPDGNIIIGGAYRQYVDVVRPHVTRLYGDSAKPALSIARSSGSAVLSWPAAFGNFQVQENTNVSLSNGWLTVAAPRSTNGNFISVTLPAPNNHKFFRLSSP